MRHTILRLNIAIFAIVMLTASTAATCRPFTIYGKIPYEHYVDRGKKINEVIPIGFLTSFGIHPIFVIYEYRIMDKRSKMKVDLRRLKNLALQTLRYPKVPVSFDVEIWSRWNVSKTPLKYIDMLEAFRKINAKSPIGLYGVIPQIFYQKNNSHMEGFEKLNESYRSVVSHVDFFSPSLYNYSGDDFSSWKKAAEFSISEARRLGDKPILPYVTPEVKEKSGTRFLSYEEMRSRLGVLKKLGVDGCIIWGGSSGISAGATFDSRQGWGKAVVEFARGGES